MHHNSIQVVERHFFKEREIMFLKLANPSNCIFWQNLWTHEIVVSNRNWAKNRNRVPKLEPKQKLDLKPKPKI